MSGSGVPRPRRSPWVLTALVAAVSLVWPATLAADTESASLPGGTALQVAISAPADGGSAATVPLTVSGSASIGTGTAVRNTALVYVIDVSGSTVGVQLEGACTSVLECEKAAILNLNQRAVELGTVGEVGLLIFAAGAVSADLHGEAGDQPVTDPDQRFSPGGPRDLDKVVESIGLGSLGLYTLKAVQYTATNFQLPLAGALGLLGSSHVTMSNKVVVMLSDGFAGEGDLQSVEPVDGVTVHTVAVGPDSACEIPDAQGGETLQAIADIHGGTCTKVTDPTDLPDVLPGLIAPALSSLEISVDGGTYGAIPTAHVSAPIPLAGPASITFSTSVAGLASGSHTICVRASGSDLGGSGSATDCHSVTLNAAPVVDAGGPYSGDEGGSVLLDASVTDDDDANVSHEWAYTPGAGVDAGAICTFVDPGAVDTSITCTDDGTYDLTLSADDSTNSAVTASTRLILGNVPPSVAITGPVGAVLAAPASVDLTSTFTDPGSNDTAACSIAWDDGSVSAPAAAAGSCDDTHVFTSAGVYTIETTVTDDDGGAASETLMVVVYDPSAGFVTGGGWIDSPAGAYAADATLTGRANFGFVSKYRKGANIPEGVTEFRFQTAGLNFHGDVYQWLVVAGAKVQYKGSGTVNGTGDYGFLLTATDGQVPGGGGADRFRIKIWDIATGDPVYDNVEGASDDIDEAAPHAIAGGSIVIHSKSN